MLAIDKRDWLGAVERPLRRGWSVLAEPRHLVWVQRLLLVLLLVWSVSSLARLLWALVPGGAVDDAPARELMNPVLPRGAARDAVAVDLTAMLGLGLFGDPSAEVADPTSTAVAVDSPREGIEDGARETRLALVLTGIVASSEDGLGSAVIEAKNSQSTYAVGDDLPVPGAVKLAKVMPSQVVLDNNGVYELLTLFDGDALASTTATDEAAAPEAQAPAPGSDAALAPDAGSAPSINIASAEAARLAADYRRQLYDNPQSLAEVVTVAAVRDGGALRGYRIAPGRNPRAFSALGFEPGDIVTAVNGLSLSDPANTVRLYQTMREATEATFDIERAGGAASVSVSLGSLE